MAVKIFRSMVIFLIIILLCGCPRKITLSVHNFTGETLMVVSKGDSLSVPRNGFVDIPEDSFVFDRDADGFEMLVTKGVRQSCHLILFAPIGVDDDYLRVKGGQKATILIYPDGGAYVAPSRVPVSQVTDTLRMPRLRNCSSPPPIG